MQTISITVETIKTAAIAFGAGAILSAIITARIARKAAVRKRQKLIREAQTAHKIIMADEYRRNNAWHNIGGKRVAK